MSYLHVDSSTVINPPNQFRDLDTSTIPSEEAIKLFDSTIKAWMNHFKVPKELWANGKLRWSFAHLPTKSPAAFATYWPDYIHLMVFDIGWWQFMSDTQRGELFLHELAHVIDRMMDPANTWWKRLEEKLDLTEGHGRRWKEIMREMSLSPDRYLKFHLADDSREQKYSVFTGISVKDGCVVANFKVEGSPKASTSLLWVFVGSFIGSVLGIALGLLWRAM